MTSTEPLVRPAVRARPQDTVPASRDWLAATAAVAFGVLTSVVGAAAGAPLEFLLLDATIGVVYLVAGAIAWRRRSEVLTGPLLVACSVLNFVGS